LKSCTLCSSPSEAMSVWSLPALDSESVLPRKPLINRSFSISCTSYATQFVPSQLFDCCNYHKSMVFQKYTQCHIYGCHSNVDSARPPTDRVLFHGRTTHLATEALLPPGNVFGTASLRNKDISYDSFRCELETFCF